MSPDKTNPPASPDPKPARNPGYAEPQPRDGHDARQPDPRRPRDPDAGGMTRKPAVTPDPVDEP